MCVYGSHSSLQTIMSHSQHSRKCTNPPNQLLLSKWVKKTAREPEDTDNNNCTPLAVLAAAGKNMVMLLSSLSQDHIAFLSFPFFLDSATRIEDNSYARWAEPRRHTVVVVCVCVCPSFLVVPRDG